MKISTSTEAIGGMMTYRKIARKLLFIDMKKSHYSDQLSKLCREVEKEIKSMFSDKMPYEQEREIIKASLDFLDDFRLVAEDSLRKNFNL